jgi:hypothetical protein
VQDVEPFVTPRLIFNDKDAPADLYTYNPTDKNLVIDVPNSSYNGEWKIRVNGLTPAETSFKLNMTCQQLK